MFFFFNDTATTEIYTLSLHDALPICTARTTDGHAARTPRMAPRGPTCRSEEHTSELQSQSNLVCRLLLEKKKRITNLTLRIRTESTYSHCTLCYRIEATPCHALSSPS